MEGSGVQVELQRMADNQSGGSALRKYIAVRAAGGVPLNFFENNWGNWLDLVEAGMMQDPHRPLRCRLYRTHSGLYREFG